MPIPTSLAADPASAGLEALRAANRAFSRRYPGETGGRQPLHTVYGGGHLFRADTARKLGAVALRALEEYGPDAAEFARAVGMPSGLADTVYRRVVFKLQREPVEDFRIDFEDGYGNRPDEEEDRHAAAAAAEVVRGLAEGTLPPFIGIRIKPLNEELRRRSIRTLDVFLTALLRTAGRLPEGFVVTLPKVTIPEQVEWFAAVLAEAEGALELAPGTLRFEIMIESPRSSWIVPAAPRSPPCSRPAAAGSARPTWAPTTTLRAATSPRRTRAWVIPPATSPAR
jgi:hypothetical protein